MNSLHYKTDGIKISPALWFKTKETKREFLDLHSIHSTQNKKILFIYD